MFINAQEERARKEREEREEKDRRERQEEERKIFEAKLKVKCLRENGSAHSGASSSSSSRRLELSLPHISSHEKVEKWNTAHEPPDITKDAKGSSKTANVTNAIMFVNRMQMVFTTATTHPIVA